MYPEIDASLIMRVPEDRKISNYPRSFSVKPFRQEFLAKEESESSTMMENRHE